MRGPSAGVSRTYEESLTGLVFELERRVDSYSEYLNLASLKYEMHLNERGQKGDNGGEADGGPSSREPAPAN